MASAGLVCRIHREGHIRELVQRFPMLHFLGSHSLRREWARVWARNGRASYDLSVICMGKTGHGKSTLLNTLAGEYLFETSDVMSCTREMQSAEFRLDHNIYRMPAHLSLCDLPGIGENREADQRYLAIYKQLVNQAGAVIWALRADQRDMGVDLDCLNSLFSEPALRKRIIIVLTMADRIEPVSRSPAWKISAAQQENLTRRQHQVAGLFGLPLHRVIPVCATEGYQLDKLMQQLADLLRDCFVDSSHRRKS